MLEFKKLELSDKELVESFVKPKKYMICEYSFAYLMIWNDLLEFEICTDGDALFIRGRHHEKWLYFPPVLKQENGNMDDEYCKIEAFADSAGEKWKVVCLEPLSISEFSKEFLEKYDMPIVTDLCDYIYYAENLINLKGKKYHSKRNHISKFNSKYKYEFLPLTKYDFDECINFYYKWKNTKPEEMTKGMMDEIGGIKKAFTYFDELGLVGACIKIDGVIQGFTVGEYTNSQMATVHFEKCNPEFDGIYASINQMFVKEYFSGCDFINRQDDIGLPGLRKAKQSYYPCMMGDKYNMIKKVQEAGNEIRGV